MADTRPNRHRGDHLPVMIMLVSFLVAHPGAGQAVPPIRQISSVLASARDTLGQLPSIRVLSNGRLLVNDPDRQRLLLMDSSLRVVRVVLDTTPGQARNYPGRFQGFLIPYLKDSTLFLDTRATSLLVLDPSGVIVRVVAPPRPSDAHSLQPNALGAPAADSRGRLVYAYSPTTRPVHADGTPLAPGDTFDMPILRASFGSQSIDTVSVIHYPFPPPPIQTQDSTGRPIMVRMVAPLSGMGPPRTDVYAVTPDGSIAIVRVQDYHIDWIRPDGSHESSPKIAHEWHRLSDDEKQRLADSASQAEDSVNARALATLRPGTELVVYKVQAAQDIPDYATPFSASAPMVEPNGNIWIASNNYPKPAGGPLYDVVDSHGTLIDRVQLPKYCTLAGLGHNVAFVTSREGMTTALVAMRVR